MLPYVLLLMNYMSYFTGMEIIRHLVIFLALISSSSSREFLLQLDSKEVVFACEKLGEDACISFVNITNNQRDKYLYKIKCTDNSLFRIRPPLRYIDSGESLTIKLIFNADKPVPESGKHYFVFYYTKANGAEPPRSAWAGKEPENMKRLYVYFRKNKKEDDNDIINNISASTTETTTQTSETTTVPPTEASLSTTQWINNTTESPTSPAVRCYTGDNSPEYLIYKTAVHCSHIRYSREYCVRHIRSDNSRLLWCAFEDECNELTSGFCTWKTDSKKSYKTCCCKGSLCNNDLDVPYLPIITPITTTASTTTDNTTVAKTTDASTEPQTTESTAPLITSFARTLTESPTTPTPTEAPPTYSPTVEQTIEAATVPETETTTSSTTRSMTSSTESPTHANMTSSAPDTTTLSPAIEISVETETIEISTTTSKTEATTQHIPETASTPSNITPTSVSVASLSMSLAIITSVIPTLW